MQQMTQFHNNPQTMTSLELRDLINAARAEHSEPEVRNNVFLKRIEDELEGELGVCKTFVNAKGSPAASYYDLTRDQCTLVGMRESKGVRRSVLNKLKAMESQQQSPQPKLPQNYLEALECLIITEKQRQAADDEARRLQVVCNTMAAQFSPGETAAQFCRQLNGVNTQQVQKWLADQGWLIPAFGGFQVSSKGRDGYFAEKHGEVDSRKTVKAVLTRKGAKWLYKQYLDGRLPMKATWDRQFTHCLFDGEVA